ncbi:hypothetical protein HOY82DRAFT_641121 [Tuber indicum]|nr:hypothetical protein HOY82DRAFT_641121 [Tuber indicum]
MQPLTWDTSFKHIFSPLSLWDAWHNPVNEHDFNSFTSTPFIIHPLNQPLPLFNTHEIVHPLSSSHVPILLSTMSRNEHQTTHASALPDIDNEGRRGRTLTRKSILFSKKTAHNNPRSRIQSPVIISSDESDLSANELIKANKLPPRRIRHIAINKKATRLTRQLEEADRRDRTTKDVSKWCTERSNASTPVTNFIAKYYLDMKLIRPLERLKFAKACVKCLRPYCGNRPTFDVADAMWRMLRALELDLEMSKECGVDTVFQSWHDKNIYFRHVQKIAMEVERRLMKMRCAQGEDDRD